MYWDRFDICAAYYWYGVNYHAGQASHWYAKLSQLVRMGYKPGLGEEYGDLSDNAREIFERLESQHCPWCVDSPMDAPGSHMAACEKHRNSTKENKS